MDATFSKKSGSQTNNRHSGSTGLPTLVARANDVPSPHAQRSPEHGRNSEGLHNLMPDRQGGKHLRSAGEPDVAAEVEQLVDVVWNVVPGA